MSAEPILPVEAAARCRVLRRLNRFVVEVEAPGGRRLRVHINNTGRLRDALSPGVEGLCRPTRRGKLGLRLFAVRYGPGYAVIDTGLQEEAFAAAMDRDAIPFLRGCRVAVRRPRLGTSVLDFLLECPHGPLYVETKSAVLLSPDGYAMYPDCPTERGRRHIRELMALGRRGAVVFIAAVPGARGFKPNREADPVLAELLREAARRGVVVEAVGMDYELRRGFIRLYAPRLPVLLGG